MRETDLFEYYSFGYNYFMLRYPSPDTPVAGDGSIISRIERFLQQLDELNLQVTATAAAQLRDILKGLKNLPAESKLDQAGYSQITHAVNRIDATLDAELQLRSAYIVTPKRIQTEHLLKNPKSLFREGVFSKLPLLCQFDFREACRCIAFERPTAAAFHCMRGVEGVPKIGMVACSTAARLADMAFSDVISPLSEPAPCCA